MEEILAKTNRLLEVARDTHPPQPNTLQRLRLALQGVVGISHVNTLFAAWLMGSLDEYIRSLTGLRRKVDDLTAHLQAARRLASGTRRHDSSAAHLAGLHGDDLFRALMALHLPDTKPPEIFLEAAVATQRLIMNDWLDKYIHLYETILFKGDTMPAYEENLRVFLHHVQTLEKFVQEHIVLAVAASSRPSTGPAN